MLKYSIYSFPLFKILHRIPVINKFIVLDIRSIESILSVKDFSFAISNFATESYHGKKTDYNRFWDLDEMALKYLILIKPLKIHDIAVSSGITSCELYRKFKKKDISFEYYISDKYSIYYYNGKNVVRIYGENKNLIYGYILGILADRNVSNLYFISKILFYFLSLKKLAPFEKYNKICMLDRETNQMVQKDEMKFIDYDVFETQILNAYNFVRCMNLLNANSWFTEEHIRKAIINIKRSIIEGGILLLGRTDQVSNVNNASFFKKENDKFILIEDFNMGSDISDIVTDV